MCRLAYIPFEAEKEDTELLATLFDFLEKSFGGHGNGIGYFVENKPWFFKGAKLETIDLANFVAEESISSIFHTRLASMGSICDGNTHPFAYNGVLTAHNGHWSDATEMAKMLIHADKFSTKNLKDMTDSEVIACLVGNYGFGATDIVDTGVILSLYNDHAKVFVKGDFEMIKTPEGKYLYASEFPRKIIDTWKVKEYFKFERGSIAKLTENGPILARGGLSKTVPSAWPTYNRRMNSFYDTIDDMYGYQLAPPIETKSEQERLSFLPKQKGKKAKKQPYTVRGIMWELSDHIGYEILPEIDAVLDTSAHIDLSDSMFELEAELKRILNTRPYNKTNRGWLAEEANLAVLAWIRINKTLIDDYSTMKTRIMENYFGDELHGDSYEDGYGNLWVYFHGEWTLDELLTETQKQELSSGGHATWEPSDTAL
jgi:predicted glutamine amidotransferase